MFLPRGYEHLGTRTYKQRIAEQIEDDRRRRAHRLIPDVRVVNEELDRATRGVLVHYPHLLPEDGFGGHVDRDEEQQRSAEPHVELVRPGPLLPVLDQRVHGHPVENQLHACQTRVVSMRKPEPREAERVSDA